jgi:opacity protein-like surface antigen
MKKLVTMALAAAALSTTVEAKGFNGFYAGLDFGLNNTSTNFSATNGATTNPNFFKVHGNALHPNLGIFLGYNKVFSNCLTLGGVFTSDFNFSKKKVLLDSPAFKLENRRNPYSWGVLATVGALLHQKSMVFVGLGIKSLNDHYKLIEIDNVTPGVVDKARNKKIRFTVQVGHETLLMSDNLAFRITYQFTPSASKRHKPDTDSTFAFTPQGHIRTKSHEQQVKLGISYRF